MLHCRRGKAAFFRSHGQDFFVVKGVSQPLGYLFTNLPSAGSKLSSNCDNHRNTAFLKIWSYVPIFTFRIALFVRNINF